MGSVRSCMCVVRGDGERPSDAAMLRVSRLYFGMPSPSRRAVAIALSFNALSSTGSPPLLASCPAKSSYWHPARGLQNRGFRPRAFRPNKCPRALSADDRHPHRTLALFQPQWPSRAGVGEGDVLASERHKPSRGGSRPAKQYLRNRLRFARDRQLC